jgi:hypothetical protein
MSPAIKNEIMKLTKIYGTGTSWLLKKKIIFILSAEYRATLKYVLDGHQRLIRESGGFDEKKKREREILWLHCCFLETISMYVLL